MSISRCKELTLTVTVVICTRNRPGLLERCLSAIAKLDPAPDQVLVVDNSAGNPDTERITRRFSAQYIVEPVQGLSRARNRSLAECSTEIIAFLDDDAVPAPGWLGNLIAVFADETIAVSAGKVLPLETGAGALATEKARTLSNRDHHWFEIATFGGMGIGCNMALRRTACAGWTVFDERLGRGAPFYIGEETYAFAGLLSQATRPSIFPRQSYFIRRSGAIRLDSKRATRSPTGFCCFRHFRGNAST